MESIQQRSLIRLDDSVASKNFFRVLKGINESPDSASILHEGIDLVDLSHLIISNSKVKSIAPLSGLLQLIYLGLSFNNIVDISSISPLVNVEYLDISHNRVNSLNSIRSLKNLKVLRCHNNKISDLEPIVKLHNLVDLWISNNSIEWVQFAYIQSLQHLKSLVMFGNPGIQQKPKIYDFVLSLCHSIEFLDGIVVSTNSTWSREFFKTTDGRVMMRQSRVAVDKLQKDIAQQQTLQVASRLPTPSRSAQRDEPLSRFPISPSSEQLQQRKEPVSIFKSSRKGIRIISALTSFSCPVMCSYVLLVVFCAVLCYA